MSTEHNVLTASTSTTNAMQDLNKAQTEDPNGNFQPPRSARSENKKRFKTISEEELRELQERKQSISTKKNTKWVLDYFKVIYHTQKFIPLFSGLEPESVMRSRVLSIKLSRSWNTDRLTNSKTLNYFPTYISLKILVLQHFLLYIKTK